MERLQGFLRTSLHALNKEALAAGRVFEVWERAVGPMVAKKVRPRGFRAGVLHLEVTSSAWAHELSLLRPQLLAALTRELGAGVVKELRLVVGGERLVPTGDEAPLTPVLERQALSPEVEGAIHEAVAGLQDPVLATAVARALASGARRQAAQRQAGYLPCPRCGELGPPPAQACPTCRAQQAPRGGV